MKIISAYVREQKRYTKNYLKQIYAFDEMEIEKFIKNLKAYGVLKSVRNNKEQLDLSNLMEEDIETINNEMMDSETISSNSMDSEMMDSEIISSNGMHSEMINNNSMNSETISNSIMNKKIIDSETIDNETVDSKTVHNETIDNETFQSETSLYVFTYVGIIIYGNRVIKIYPKYLLSASEIEPPVEEMKQVLKVLEKYNHSKEQQVFHMNGDGENHKFHILEVSLFLLNDYFSYGIYTNSEQIVETNGEGEILWGKTVDESVAFIQENRPYYMEFYTEKIIDDDIDYFKKLHEYVLTECARQLHEAQLDKLFDMNILEVMELSEQTLADFGDRDYILERINKELNIQFHTREQRLLKTLYAYILEDKKMFQETDSICMYGTSAYHVVWETVCAEVFDNKLHTTLEQLPMSMELAEQYQPMKRKTLLDLIEKPIWENGDTIKTAASTFLPDLISISQINDADAFVIFDAKYYNIQLEKGKALRGNPSVNDVAKQYLYQLAYRDFIQAHNITIVKNCFLMPTEKSEMIKTGTAKLPMLTALGLENIQIRQLPANLLYEYYLNQKKIEISLLEL